MRNEDGGQFLAIITSIQSRSANIKIKRRFHHWLALTICVENNDDGVGIYSQMSSLLWPKSLFPYLLSTLHLIKDKQPTHTQTRTNFLNFSHGKYLKYLPTKCLSPHTHTHNQQIRSEEKIHKKWIYVHPLMSTAWCLFARGFHFILITISSVAKKLTRRFTSLSLSIIFSSQKRSCVQVCFLFIPMIVRWKSNFLVWK